jgi:nicotinate-nucleotide adenylyltransferase
MVKKATIDNCHFTYSDWELTRDRISYTVETLKHYQNKGFDDIYFIIGADSLLDMPNWEKAKYLLGHAQFIVARRSSFPVKTVCNDDFYKPYLNNIHIIDSVRIDISSTEIREMVNNNHSIRYLVPKSVLDYISNNSLYNDG